MAKAAESNKQSISVSKENKTVTIKNLTIDNQLVYEYFGSKKVTSDTYVETMQKAIYIGVLALMEDRLSTFLANTKNELGVQLESLKLIYDIKIKEFTGTNKKGTIAETMVYQALSEYINENNFNDDLELTGNKGQKDGNKTGDLMVTLNDIEKKIAIEVKLDGSVTLGEVGSKVERYKKNDKDTAISQLLEQKFNRDASNGIIVFDYSNVNPAIKNAVKNGIKYYSGIGFVVIVDILSNDYKNLFIAYLLVREMVYNNSLEQMNNEWINLFIRNLMNDIKSIQNLKASVQSIKSGLDNTILACVDLTDNINKHVANLENNYNYFNDFIKNNNRDSKAFFEYFNGNNARETYKKLKEEQE